MKYPLAIPRQHGFSLVEVLVTILILSFGISSIGMMMLATMQNSRGALLRTKAVGFANDMAERIRANYEARTLYDTASNSGSNNSCFQNGGTAPPSCSPAQLAAHDIWHWNELLDDPALGLPTATGSITIDNTVNPAQYQITVQWLEAQNRDDPTNPIMATFTLVTLL